MAFLLFTHHIGLVVMQGGNVIITCEALLACESNSGVNLQCRSLAYDPLQPPKQGHCKVIYRRYEPIQCLFKPP